MAGKYFYLHTYENPNAENEWYAKGKEEHARMKGEMFRRSRDRIKSMDAVLTLNFDKNGKKNYVGGSTFLELYEAFMEGKKIYLWNEVLARILFDEISGFAPEIINSNLNLVKQEIFIYGYKSNNNLWKYEIFKRNYENC